MYTSKPCSWFVFLSHGPDHPPAGVAWGGCILIRDRCLGGKERIQLRLLMEEVAAPPRLLPPLPSHHSTGQETRSRLTSSGTNFNLPHPAARSPRLGEVPLI
ncbi:hypothetical protein E2C01_089311 [Portunus trituberculatus]|uniref:Uncharacterized protein n=1 Tax=Portunus trituberculatus TaxID=210409 RepID=A0A5B7JHU2_PORTR|nr:hypothetical protein [Portunus trituberculatus]